MLNWFLLKANTKKKKRKKNNPNILKLKISTSSNENNICKAEGERGGGIQSLQKVSVFNGLFNSAYTH